MAIIKKANNITIKTKENSTIIVKGKMEVIANKISFTATKGNLRFSSLKKIQIRGIENGVKYGSYVAPKESNKHISEVMWMDSKMEKQISDARTNELLSMKVKTENYNVGDRISVTVKDQEYQDKTIELIGYVQEDGYALLQEIMYVDPVDLYKHSNIA